MKVFQRTAIRTFHYPFADKLNPKLHEIILQQAVNRDMGATMTAWKAGFHIKEFSLIGDWAFNTVKNFNEVGTAFDDIFELHLKDMWGQYYKRGDYQITHHHNPHYWSFVYFVNTPSGSSPLVLQDKNGWKKIKAEEGKIICFPAWIYHHVPPNKCKERSVVVGNLGYDFF